MAGNFIITLIDASAFLHLAHSLPYQEPNKAYKILPVLQYLGLHNETLSKSDIKQIIRKLVVDDLLKSNFSGAWWLTPGDWSSKFMHIYAMKPLVDDYKTRCRVFLHIEMKFYVRQRCYEKYNEIWNCLFVNEMKFLNQKLVLEKYHVYVQTSTSIQVSPWFCDSNLVGF